MFRTYQKNKKQKFTLGKLLSILMMINAIVVISIYIVVLFPQMYRMKDELLELTIPFIFLFLGLSTLKILYYVFFHSRNKKEIGTLVFSENEIQLNNQNYPIFQIEQLRLIGNDIKGDFRGYISNGTDNQIIIHLKNNEKVASFFEQTKNNTLKKEKEVLLHYQNLKLLSEANYENIMNNTNYY